MEKENINILTQYADAVARVKYLRKEISKLEDKIYKLETTDYGACIRCCHQRQKGR